MEGIKNTESEADKLKRREEAKIVYSDLTKRFFSPNRTKEDSEEWEYAKWDVLSQDEPTAIAAIESFVDAGDVMKIMDIITQTGNDEVKLFAAKWLGPVSNIQGLYESYKPENLLKHNGNPKYHEGEMARFIIDFRVMIQRMVDATTGETKEVLTDKLEDYNRQVGAFDLTGY